jgi:hypothetical protein
VALQSLSPHDSRVTRAIATPRYELRCATSHQHWLSLWLVLISPSATPLQEPDFEQWRSRLFCYGLDLRNLIEVHRFVDWVNANFDRLDIIVNNAAQTVRRPPSFYSHLIPAELTALPPMLEAMMVKSTAEAPQHMTDMAVPRLLAAEAIALQPSSDANVADHATITTKATISSSSALMSQVPLLDEDHHVDSSMFPKGFYDEHQQQIDLRCKNSWTMKMDEVATVEVIEVHAINAIAPFIINSKLKPLMQRTKGVCATFTRYDPTGGWLGCLKQFV